jgi:hypothetical protein
MRFFSFFWRREPTDQSDNGIQSKKELNFSDDRSGTDTDGSHSVIVEEEHDTLKGVMEDNLDLMLEIIMKVREDEEFAKSIYEDCPRLQLLLDQNPDLRPIFEDPHFIRMNFEQVYRNAGGVLPEDRQNAYYEKFKETLVVVTNHPLFKVFRFLLLLKRMYNCVVNGYINLIRQTYLYMFGLNGFDPTNLSGLLNNGELGDLHKVNLLRAADHMEDPAVQEHMATLLESNPEDLDEAIEQDPDLMALRDSNPFCAELMSDPSTIKILLDPDNLRALAECPDLIAADFADPDWMPPDIDEYHFDDAMQSELGVDGDLVEEEEAHGLMDSGIIEEIEAPESAAASNHHQQQQQQRQQQGNQNENNQGGVGGMVSAGLFGYVTAQIGFSPSDFTIGGGGGDELAGLDTMVEDTVQTTTNAAVENAKTATDAAAHEAQLITDSMESAANQVAEAGGSCERESQEAQTAAYNCVTSAATAVAVGGAMMVGGGGGRKVETNDENDKENNSDGKEIVDGENTNPRKSVRRFFQRNQ